MNILVALLYAAPIVGLAAVLAVFIGRLVDVYHPHRTGIDPRRLAAAGLVDESASAPTVALDLAMVGRIAARAMAERGPVVGVAPVPAKRPKQVTTCPTCKAPLPGLLAACPKPDCLRETTGYEARLDRRWDL